MVEVEHDLLQVALAHLPMCDANVSLRNQLLQSFCNTIDIFDAIVDKVHLATTFYFTQARFANYNVVPFADKSFY